MCFPCCSLLLLPFPGPRRFKMRCLPALSSMQLDPAPSRQGTSPPPTPLLALAPFHQAHFYLACLALVHQKDSNHASPRSCWEETTKKKTPVAQ